MSSPNPNVVVQPVWQWRVGETVWLSLPLRSRGLAAAFLVGGLLSAATFTGLLLLLDRWWWVWAIGLLVASLQVALGVASLVALRIQRRVRLDQ